MTQTQNSSDKIRLSYTFMEMWRRGKINEALDMYYHRNMPLPFKTIEEALEWPQLRQRKRIAHLWNPLSKSFGRPRAPGFPIKFSEVEEDYGAGAPIPGEHTKVVLSYLS